MTVKETMNIILNSSIYDICGEDAETILTQGDVLPRESGVPDLSRYTFGDLIRSYSTSVDEYRRSKTEAETAKVYTKNKSIDFKRYAYSTVLREIFIGAVHNNGSVETKEAIMKILNMSVYDYFFGLKNDIPPDSDGDMRLEEGIFMFTAAAFDKKIRYELVKMEIFRSDDPNDDKHLYCRSLKQMSVSDVLTDYCQVDQIPMFKFYIHFLTFIENLILVPFSVAAGVVPDVNQKLKIVFVSDGSEIKDGSDDAGDLSP